MATTGKRVVSVSRRMKRARSTAIAPCLATMGCLCAAHARGARPTDRCDATEPELRSSACRCEGDNCGETPCASSAPRATDGVFLARLDPALLDMIRDNARVIRLYYPDLDVPSWDDPTCWHEGDTAEALKHSETRALYGHAVGFIAGCAAMVNMTPGDLVDTIG